MATGMPKRERWADLRDSSCESLPEDSPRAQLLVASSVDSYIDAPDQDLAENPNALLNQQMKHAASVAPRDFGSFMETSKRRRDTPAARGLDSVTENLFNDEAAAKKDGFASWQPNAAAPEFTPMPRRHAMPNLDRAPTEVFSPFLVDGGGGLVDLVDDGAGFVPSLAAPTASPQSVSVRRRINRKRGQPVTTPTAQTPTAQARTGKRQCLVPSETPPSNAAALPEASEETWEKRIEKRRMAVAAVKASPEYQAGRGHAPQQGAVGTGAPGTPEPTDRTVSKRKWEEEVRLWRVALRQAA